jgi:4-hydroxy-tetrahydrodipicolinate synthase
MNQNTLPGGLWPVMLTPFRSDLSLDLDGLKELTDFYLRAGATGLFVNCLSSEMYHLTNEERVRITQTVVDRVGASFPVVSCGSFTSEVSEMKDFIRQIHDTGVTAVIISTNWISDDLHPDVVKTQWMELLESTTGIALGTYECPDPFKRLLSIEEFTMLSKTNRFFYHKDTSCDLDMLRLKMECSAGTNLRIFNAHTPTARMSLQMGLAGLSPIGANFFPELFEYLCSTQSNPDTGPLESFLIQHDPYIHENYPYVSKVFLQKRGLNIDTFCRTRFKNLDSVGSRKLDRILSKSEQVMSEYSIINAASRAL